MFVSMTQLNLRDNKNNTVPSQGVLNVLGANTLDVASENPRINNRRLLDSVLDYYHNNVVKIWASYQPFDYNNSRVILLCVKEQNIVLL